MSEVQSRPSAARGRGSHRTGRGGLASRGGGRTSGRQTNGDAKDQTPTVSLDEQGELGQLKKQYASQLVTLRELFPDWTDDDLVFACQETDGDLPNTIERITEGNVSRFADVKKKDKTRPKTKDTPTVETSSAPTRGRGRGGLESSRGGRGRGSDRGRGAGRGARGGPSTTAVARSAGVPNSVPTTESTEWGAAPGTTSSWDDTSNPVDGNTEIPVGGQWGNAASSKPTAVTTDVSKSSLIPEGGVKKSWAMIAKPPKPAPAAPKPRTVPETSQHPEVVGDGVVPPDLSDLAHPHLEEAPTFEDQGSDSPAIQVTPPANQLTEDNLEHIPDNSGPVTTETVASTRDPRSTVGTPYATVSSQQPPISRPPVGGYATNAWKATGMPGRNASYQRRIMEQQEAVVMPMNHAVDRAAVQFGSMGLNGGDDGTALDLDDDREEPETRAQPPQQSPAQPRASLPPTTHQAPVVPEPSLPINITTPKQAPGLPYNPSGHQQTSQIPPGPQGLSQQGSLGNQPYGQYGRFGAGALNQDQNVSVPKQPDTFNQQQPYSSSLQDQSSAYPAHTQASTQPQQAQSHLAGLSTGSNDFPSQYSGDQQRNAYQSYYGSTTQPGSLGQPETSSSYRTGGGFSTAPGESNYQSGQGQQMSARFTENQASGHTTPNPTAATQGMGGPQGQQGQHMPQQHGQAGHSGGYPYGNPYYGNSYYGQYMGQYPNQYNYNQQSYGGHYGGKNNHYGQPHHGYGMSPQASYEHSSSPANTSGFGASSVPGRDSAFPSGLNDFGRSGSAQASQSQPQASSSGGYNDSLGRSSSGFANQNQQFSQTSLGGSEEPLRPSQDARVGAGPSPYGQPGRPGSAANSAGNASSQSGYPPGQTQQGYGGYPNHLNPLQSNSGSGYGSLGGLGGHQGAGQSHQSGSYGNYGGGFGNTYGGNYGRGGWGGNYGH